MLLVSFTKKRKSDKYHQKQRMKKDERVTEQNVTIKNCHGIFTLRRCTVRNDIIHKEKAKRHFMPSSPQGSTCSYDKNKKIVLPS
jgi:hypothetical protein